MLAGIVAQFKLAILEACGFDRPDISVLSEEFLLEIQHMQHIQHKNSIILMHFAAPRTGAFGLEVALDRLGAYLGEELDALSRTLALAGQDDALSDIAELAGLHLDARTTPGDVRALLQEARTRLERLLDSVRRIPPDCEITAPAPEDFDAGVCWAGARLEDIVATLSHALAA